MKARKTIALTQISRATQVRRLVSALERKRRATVQDVLGHDVWPQHFAAKGKVPPP